MIKLTLELFKDLIIRPRGAYVAIVRSPHALYGALAIFAASIMAEAAVLYLLPAGFLPGSSAKSADLLHMAVQTGVELLSISAILFFLTLFGSMARTHKGPSFMLLTASGLFIPAIAVSSFQSQTPASVGLLFAIIALVLGGLFKFSQDPNFPYRQLAAVVLLSNGLTLPLVPFQLLAGYFRSETFYMVATVFFSLWMIRFMVIGMAYVLKLSTARSAVVFISCIFGVMLLVSALAKTGVMPAIAAQAMEQGTLPAAQDKD